MSQGIQIQVMVRKCVMRTQDKRCGCFVEKRYPGGSSMGAGLVREALGLQLGWCRGLM